MLALISLVATAVAQDPEFETATVVAEEEATAEESETTASAELGGLWTSGNAQLYAVNAGIEAQHRWDRNQLSGVLGANLGAAVPDANGDGRVDENERLAGYVENARRAFTDVRYDRFLSDRDSVYALAGAFHDVFAGYDLRSHEQVGYSRLLVKNDSSTLRLEGGLDWAQEWRTTDEYANIVAARVLVGLKHAFNDNVRFSETLELYENILTPEDLRILNTATLSSTLNSTFSLKLSHALIFDNLPVEGFRKLDQTTAVTLVVTLARTDG